MEKKDYMKVEKQSKLKKLWFHNNLGLISKPSNAPKLDATAAMLAIDPEE